MTGLRDRHSWLWSAGDPATKVQECRNCGTQRKIAAGTTRVWLYQFACGRWFYTARACGQQTCHRFKGCVGSPQCSNVTEIPDNVVKGPW